MSKTNNAAEPRTREQLVAKWKELNRALNDERQSDLDWEAIRRERDAYQAEIDALEVAS